MGRIRRGEWFGGLKIGRRCGSRQGQIDTACVFITRMARWLDGSMGIINGRGVSEKSPGCQVALTPQVALQPHHTFDWPAGQPSIANLDANPSSLLRLHGGALPDAT